MNSNDELVQLRVCVYVCFKCKTKYIAFSHSTKKA